MKVNFYGPLGDSIGRRVELAVPPPGCTVAELRRMIGDRHPHAAEDLARPSVRACVGDTLVSEDCLVAPTDSVEFFPPLSGG